MPRNQELTEFYNDLNQEIINKAAINEDEDFRENTFTEIFTDYLVEAAEIEYGDVCFHEARGIKINAYCFPEDDSDLILFVSHYDNSPDVYSLPPSEVNKLFQRVKEFYKKSTEGYYVELEDAFGAFDLAKYIYDKKADIQTVRLMLLTNGTVRSMYLPHENEGQVTYIYQIWDLERVYRLIGDPGRREKVEFSLKDFSCNGLNCIKVQTPEVKKTDKDGNVAVSGGYTSYFTVFPGELLFKIYDQYNARLLEKNVRAFLQARGGVNKGIKKTITEEPEMFLAYNNGISATAESVTVKNIDEDNCVILGMRDFQIVNGGQTTASIFNTCVKNQLPLSNIKVQAKITVLDNQSQMGEVVPKISLYANSQNKVQQADFSANDEFHQELEKLSRSVWAPAKTGGEQQSKWFYERSRGQYADTRSRYKNTKYFDSIFPKNQYFDKLQLARYYNTWEQLPYIAAKGGQASFADFTIRLKKEHKNFIPDLKYYYETIGIAILYITIRKIVKMQKFQGFWADVADYSMSYLSYKTAKRINLFQIWKDQDIPDYIQKDIERIAKAVYDYLITHANGRNIQQWCKQKGCWESVKENIQIELSSETKKFVYTKSDKQELLSSDSETNSESSLIKDLYEIDYDVWGSISSWGKETGSLASFQNGISYSLMKAKRFKKEMSFKQAKQGLIILRTAYEKGFLTDTKIKKILDDHSEDV